MLTYAPDGEGRPAIVTTSAGQNPVSATTYNTASLPTKMTLGSNDSDSFSFDPNTNRLTQFQFSVNSKSLTGIIGWNPLGTPASLDISDAFNSADTQDCSYAHDDLTRLATVNCGVIWGQNFAYDAFGNISKTVLSGSSGTAFQPTYAVPSTNRIASLPSFTPTYDANGNVTKDPQHQYSWNSEGRPVTIDTVALTYDALDRIAEQSSGGTFTQTVYDALGDKFALMNGQVLMKAFAPLPDGGTAVYTSSGLVYYRHPDWLGSSRLASTPSQGIYSDTAYAPFGEPYAQSGAADVSFTGQNQDTASNLYDFLYREHSPIQGRWISPDPAGLSAVNLTDPQSWNRYAYVRNSPLKIKDRLGLSFCFYGGDGDDPRNDTDPTDFNNDDTEGDCGQENGVWIDDSNSMLPTIYSETDLFYTSFLYGIATNFSTTPDSGTSSLSWWLTAADTFVSNFVSPSFYKEEIKKGGCINTAYHAAVDAVNPLSSTPSFATDSSQAAIAANEMMKYNAAQEYAAAQTNVIGGQGLIFPQNSIPYNSIYEGSLAGTLTAGFAGFVDYGLFQGVSTEFQAAVTGTCH
jgi:RHS repeat-associated protein